MLCRKKHILEKYNKQKGDASQLMMPAKIPVKFECERCGDCCKRDWDLKLDSETITNWVREKRDDLLYHVVFHPRFLMHPEYSDYEPILIIDNGHILFGDYPKHVCPFLVMSSEGRASCKIQEVKPRVCKEFPFKPGENGEYYVRTDALKLCRGVRDYFRRCAQVEDRDLDEYMKSIQKVEAEPESIPIPRDVVEMLKKHYENLSKEEKATGLLFPELKDKRYASIMFKRFAKIYKRMNLKVRITSLKGMSILDACVHEDISKIIEITDTIRKPAEALMREYFERET